MDDIRQFLSLPEMLGRKCLPDRLPIGSIAKWWADNDNRLSEIYIELINRAVLSGELQSFDEASFVPDSQLSVVDKTQIKRTFFLIPEGLKWIDKGDFKQWLINSEHWPLNDCLLANWWLSELHKSDKDNAFLASISKAGSLSFYSAYKELEKRLNNLTYTEFALFVFDGDIRIFEKRLDGNGKLKQLSGCGELNKVGIADTISCELTPLHLTLSKFCYVKEDIDRLTPSYRYICFDDTCKEIAYFANKPKEEIKEFLIQKAQYGNFCPHHPYCGFAHPEQESLWPDSAYPDYKIIQILRDDFGISEYEYAFDIEAYIDELKAKGNSDDEVNRMRKVIDKRLESSATLIEKQNAVAELAAFRTILSTTETPLVSDLKKNLLLLPKSPSYEDRVKGFVWLDILNRRKAKIDNAPPCDARTKELDDLNDTITYIEAQLGCSGNKQQDQLTETTPIVDKNLLEGKSKTRNQLDKVNEKFTSFKSLSIRDVSFVMMSENDRAKMTIKGKTIFVYPDDLGLSPQDWKLISSASIANGCLKKGLERLNKTSNREKEKNKIKNRVSRLRSKLKDAMGLIDNPVSTGGSYRFLFKVMKNELTEGGNVTKGDDTMDHSGGDCLYEQPFYDNDESIEENYD